MLALISAWPFPPGVTLDLHADRLSRIEQEVMQQVGTKLPAEMILLDEVQQIASR